MAAIQPHELAERVAGLTVLDVRSLVEWKMGHIQGAQHVPVDEVEKHLDELDRTRAVVTVCRGGQRAEHATALLRAHGFTAQTLEGGMLAWAAQGLQVIDPAGCPGVVAEAEHSCGDRPFDAQRFHDDLVTIGNEIREQFGDRVPSEAEIRTFFRDRLVAQGMAPEEAERTLDA